MGETTKQIIISKKYIKGRRAQGNLFEPDAK